MFSKPSEPRSIASQLVFRFTVAAALLLCCGLVVLYLIVVRHAFEEDNVFLADKIFALRADLSKAGGPDAFNEELKTTRARRNVTYWVRVLDSTGRTVAQTPGMDGLLPSSIFPQAESSIQSIWSPHDFRTRDKTFALVSTIDLAGGQAYTIQVAQDRSADETFTKEFGALLIIVLAFGILASALIAATVTKRGLRPLT
jgi:hypothetical protein